MKQLNLYYLGGGGGGSTPDGRTITPTDDVEIWLSCAGISGTGYTTVAEVIADTGVLTSVLGSDNANDYLARSTTFASDICADNLAMTTIGANNYAANALIDNSVWIDAIVGSTYREAILNDKIPAMTSDTTPSGKCYASSFLNSTYEPWKAFTGRYDYYNSYWHSQQGMPQWLAYHFPEAKKIRAVEFLVNRNGGPTSSKFQYSDDGSTWVDVGAFPSASTPNTIVRKAYIIADNHTDFRIFCTASNYNNYFPCAELQLYGRKDV